MIENDNPYPEASKINQHAHYIQYSFFYRFFFYFDCTIFIPPLSPSISQARMHKEKERENEPLKSLCALPNCSFQTSKALPLHVGIIRGQKPLLQLKEGQAAKRESMIAFFKRTHKM